MPTKERKQKDAIYCGVGPLPAGKKKYGSMTECAELKKIMRWGQYKVDSKILDKVIQEQSGDIKDMTKKYGNLKIKYASLIGKVKGLTKKIDDSDNKKEIKQLEKEKKETENELNKVMEEAKKMKDILEKQKVKEPEKKEEFDILEESIEEPFEDSEEYEKYDADAPIIIDSSIEEPDEDYYLDNKKDLEESIEESDEDYYLDNKKDLEESIEEPDEDYYLDNKKILEESIEEPNKERAVKKYSQMKINMKELKDSFKKFYIIDNSAGKPSIIAKSDNLKDIKKKFEDIYNEIDKITYVVEKNNVFFLLRLEIEEDDEKGLPSNTQIVEMSFKRIKFDEDGDYEEIDKNYQLDTYFTKKYILEHDNKINDDLIYKRFIYVVQRSPNLEFFKKGPNLKKKIQSINTTSVKKKQGRVTAHTDVENIKKKYYDVDVKKFLENMPKSKFYIAYADVLYGENLDKGTKKWKIELKNLVPVPNDILIKYPHDSSEEEKIDIDYKNVEMIADKKISPHRCKHTYEDGINLIHAYVIQIDTPLNINRGNVQKIDADKTILTYNVYHLMETNAKYNEKTNKYKYTFSVNQILEERFDVYELETKFKENKFITEKDILEDFKMHGHAIYNALIR